MYRIHQISLGLDETEEKIPEKILKKIGAGRKAQLISITDWKIVRESIDARDKSDIRRVYTVDFDIELKGNGKNIKKLGLKLETAPNTDYCPAVTEQNARPLKHRPVIVGFGPAGIFAGLILAQAGYRPLILERGADIDKRTSDVEKFWENGQLNVNSNVQFGEGGAGTFSDGKLTTGIKDARISKVLNELVSGGGPKDILYKQKAHIGTDLLRNVVKSIRETIKSLGGEIRFNTYVSDFEITDKKLTAVMTGSGEIIPCEAAIFAIGHSSRDTFRWLNQKHIKMEQKPFSIGVRIEHPQDLIDIAQYGRPAAELGLPVADYKLNHRCKDGRGVYTFCMCPGGRVIAAASQKGGVVTNGMSLHARDSGVANSALLCDVRTSDFGSDDVLAGVEFQEKYEKLAFINGGNDYSMPKATWGELRDGKAQNVENSLPEFAVEAMREAMPYLAHKLKGFDDENAIVTAVESRSSSPVRFGRNSENMTGMLCIESSYSYKKAFTDEKEDCVMLEGFYPCGEGAGYAGGIMSAAVDGIKVAEAIIKKYNKSI